MPSRPLFLLLLVSLLSVSLSSCSTWRELGEKPKGPQLARLAESPHFNPDKQAFENRRPEVLQLMNERITLRSIGEFFFSGIPDQTPAQPLPAQQPVDLEAFLADGPAVKFIWLGHSTLLLNVKGTRILIDPVFSKAASPVKWITQRFQPPVLALEALPKIDVIVISHDHYDHLDMETIEFFRDQEVAFFVPLGISSHLQYWGIDASRITELDWWEEARFQDLTLTCTPAQHFSGRTGQTQVTLWASWVLEQEGQRVYFSGDSGYDQHYREIGERFGRFDVAFIDSGQYHPNWREVHNLPEEAVQAAVDLKADWMVPIHWGQFKLALHEWYAPPQESQKHAAEKGVSQIIPQLGEVVDLSQPPTLTPWWVTR